MGKNLFFSCLLMITAFSAKAYVPECPYFNNKKSCLDAVEKGSYQNFEYIREEYMEDSQPPMIEANLNIEKFEAQACQRTCYN